MLPEEPFRSRLTGSIQARANHAVILSLDGEILYGGALLALIEDVHSTLCGLGFRRGHRIASTVARGVASSAAALAIGSYCSYVPLNSAQNGEEWAAVLESVGPAALLVHPKDHMLAVRMARHFGVTVLSFSGLTLHVENSYSLPPENALPGERFLCQTSGTTVRPKYVPKTGAGICASMDQICGAIPFYPDDRCAVTVPAFYSLGLVSNILLPALTGGSAIHTEGPAELFDACVHHGVTWMATPPATLHDLIQYARDRGIRLNRPLRLIRTAGAIVGPELAAGALEVFGAPVLSSYGATEAPVMTTVRLGDAPAVRHSGRLSPGVTIRFDAGEVVATASSMATTYWNDPEATRLAFETDAAGRSWYRTGDIGHFDDDGNLHLIGRKTDVINRGGLKVGPWEVEAALLKHPAVREAVAFKIPDIRLGEEIAAAVTLHGARRAITEGQLRGFSSRQLTLTKTPRRVFIVDEIPRNEMGKPLRARLTERFGEAAPVVDRIALLDAAPTDLESGLMRLCGEVLGVTGIRRHDNFFDLGGNSASAVDYLSRVSAQYHLESINPALLFEANSFSLLADRLRYGAISQSVVDLRPELDTESVPLVIVCVDPESYASPWRTLVRDLPPAQRVYLLKPSLSGASSFADMAGLLIAALREELPHGPYAFAGTCLMAALAHEMTRQLEQDGEHVTVVFGIDTWFPFANRELRRRHYFDPRRVRGIWREAGGLAGFLGRAKQSLINRTRGLRSTPQRPLDLEIEAAKAACRAHTAAPIDARLVTIWSEHLEAIIGHNPDALWGGMTRQEFVVEYFRGDRFAMLGGLMNRQLAGTVERHLKETSVERASAVFG